MNTQERVQEPKSIPFLKLFLTLAFAITLPLLLVAPHSESQSPKQIKSKEEQIREDMVRISAELGVTCTACHNSKNFKDDRLSTFKVAREHTKITQLLIDRGFDGKNGPKATCYMCHRGQLKPDYQMKKDPLISNAFNSSH